MLAYKQASTSFFNPGFVLSARGLAVSEDARIRTEIEHPHIVLGEPLTS